MKKFIATSATVLFIGITVFAQDNANVRNWYVNVYPRDLGVSQNPRFEIRGRYARPVTKVKLNDARLVSDFIPGYPVHWITDYVSVEILATCNGKAMKAESKNDILTAEQKSILNTIDMATDIVINVRYKSRNAATNNIDVHTMNVSMTIIPETEAEYVGGYQQMIKYIRENLIDKFSEAHSKQFEEGIVIFTVNEEGKIINAKIFKTSGDNKADKLLLEAINKMPKWRPAKNSKGKNVKQEFELTVNAGEEGC